MDCCCRKILHHIYAAILTSLYWTLQMALENIYENLSPPFMSLVLNLYTASSIYLSRYALETEWYVPNIILLKCPQNASIPFVVQDPTEYSFSLWQTKTCVYHVSSPLYIEDSSVTTVLPSATKWLMMGSIVLDLVSTTFFATIIGMCLLINLTSGLLDLLCLPSHHTPQHLQGQHLHPAWKGPWPCGECAMLSSG